MKTILTSIILLALTGSSCRMAGVVPSSNLVSYDISAPTLNSIDVATSIAVEFTQSDVVKISVSCPENLSDYLEISVSNGELKARFKDGVSINGDCNVVLAVSAPTLRSIDASSSSSVEITSGLKQSGNLEIEASSSAKVVIAGLEAADVDADASSSASIDMDGIIASELELDCSSSGHITAAGLKCMTVNADASSATTIRLSGVTMYASYEASSAASIDARKLMADKLKSAKSSSAANIRCSAKTSGHISEESSGSVSID